MKYAWFIICSIFIIFSSVAYSQTDLNFEYSVSNNFKSPVHYTVKLQLPNGVIYNLYSDTINKVRFVKTGYFKHQGDYLLIINFSTADSINETIDYGFTLNSKETIVEINISFYYDWEKVKEDGRWVEKRLSPKGYISVAKIYSSPASVSLVLDSIKSNKAYKGPFFRLTNTSDDTLYGKYLPGYFWGTLSYKDSDSLWYKEKMGQIDINFGERPPLLPGLRTIATVGSFGIRATEEMKEGYYRFTLYYSTKPSSFGYGLYKRKDNFEWREKKNEFYKIVYMFKIE